MPDISLFEAPAGQDLLFTARTEDGSVATLNLFVSYGETPTRVRHDRSATQPFTLAAIAGNFRLSEKERTTLWFKWRTATQIRTAVTLECAGPRV